MKKSIPLFFFLCMLFTAQGQEKSSGFEAGFQLNQFGGDFGLGVNVVSPSILKESIQIRLRANAMYLEYIDEGEASWDPYYNIMLGSSSTVARIHEAIGLYGEGGAIILIPSNKASSEGAKFGGYGIFGFEFYFADSFVYFLEAGGIGINAVANKYENQPIYSNGFLMSVGFRVKF